MIITTRKKYREMILDAADTVLGYFGFDRTVMKILQGMVERKRTNGITNCSKKKQKISRQSCCNKVFKNLRSKHETIITK